MLLTIIARAKTNTPLILNHGRSCAKREESGLGTIHHSNIVAPVVVKPELTSKEGVDNVGGFVPKTKGRAPKKDQRIQQRAIRTSSLA